MPLTDNQLRPFFFGGCAVVVLVVGVLVLIGWLIGHFTR